jgi:hypothetical protein
VVLSANGRIKPDVVLVDEREERHPEGAYYISCYEGKRLIRLSVGKDAQEAAARRQRKEAKLSALNNGVAVLTEKGNGYPSVATAVALLVGTLFAIRRMTMVKAIATYGLCSHQLKPLVVFRVLS